jgi:hypothetical protein
MICYDREDDNTLPFLKGHIPKNFKIDLVKNEGKGAHGAVLTGFRHSKAGAVIVFPGDDTTNAVILDRMFEKFKEGCDVVAASRFMKGGCMKGCPLLKSILVRSASFTLYWLAAIPIKDASNGFRLFSRRVLDNVLIESQEGFTYSLELLVKCHRLGWKISEVPALWYERTKGKSNFHTIKWLFPYLRWYFYGFKTTYLCQGPLTVKMINP